jgi:hypothetical protein
MSCQSLPGAISNLIPLEVAAELAGRLELYDPSPGHRLEINGEEWEVWPDGKRKSAGKQKRR